MPNARDFRPKETIARVQNTIACSVHGVSLWPGTPLLTKLGGRFVVRPRDRVYDLVCRLHGPRAAWTPLLPALERAASELNAGDVDSARAGIARLVLPPLTRDGGDLAAAIAKRTGLEMPRVPVASSDGTGLRPDVAAALAAAYDGVSGGPWAIRKVEADGDFDARHPRLGAKPNPGWFVPVVHHPASAAESAARLATLDRHLKNPNVRAFLDMIAEAEGGRYNLLYGGKVFQDYASFPGAADHSPAGRYQITRPTYDGLSAELGLTDFSPTTQDYMAAQLLIEFLAMQPLLAGDIDGAITAAAGKWNALPLGPGLPNRKSRQPHVSYEQAKQSYARHRRNNGEN